MSSREAKGYDAGQHEQRSQEFEKSQVGNDSDGGSALVAEGWAVALEPASESFTTLHHDVGIKITLSDPHGH